MKRTAVAMRIWDPRPMRLPGRSTRACQSSVQGVDLISGRTHGFPPPWCTAGVIIPRAELELDEQLRGRVIWGERGREDLLDDDCIVLYERRIETREEKN